MIKAFKTLIGFYTFSFLSVCSLSNAGFSAYDARTLGMGNTSVALANTKVGYFYNPSLLAFHYEDEDETRDGLILAPTLILEYSDAAKEVYELIDKDLDTRFNDSIDLYNATPNQINATSAEGLARRLRRIVNNVKGKDINVSSSLAFGASEVGEFGGGSFFVASRVVGGGLAFITPEDEDLFDEYIGALSYVAEGGTDCFAQTDFSNAFEQAGTGAIECELRDPDARFTSIAIARGAVIGEAGVSFSSLYHRKDIMVAWGASPKVMILQALDENRRFSDDNFNIETDLKSHLFLNFDAGVTIDYKERYRLALAVKDVLKKTFETQLSNALKVAPSYRMGFAYLDPLFSIGIDYDLNKSPSFAGELQRQEFSLGAEIPVLKQAYLRFGYRTDTLNNYDDISSLGLGFSSRYIVIEGAYAKSKDQESYALQLGFPF